MEEEREEKKKKEICALIFAVMPANAHAGGKRKKGEKRGVDTRGT